MIEIRQVTKKFENITALNGITFSIPKGKVFGLLGTNGAGKSTLLRCIAGILECGTGEILVDGEIIYDHPKGKEKFFYLPDDPYYFPGASMEQMAEFYHCQYPDMDVDGVNYMAGKLDLDVRRPIRTFSKGMKRQAFLILALCANTEYLLCDEVFDGLDPVLTEVMKKLLGREMEQRNLTVVVAAHKLQDLEDFCQDIGILHKGGLLLAGDMRERAEKIYKIQCVWKDNKEEDLRKCLDVVRYRREGYFTTLTVRGNLEEILEKIRRQKPVFCEEVPMTLEEVFIAEMEETGYDIGKVLR